MNIITQMQAIYSSNQTPEAKTDQVGNLLNAHWGTLITSAGRANAMALENLSNNFQFLASRETNPEVQKKISALANHLSNAAREAQTPNLHMTEDGMMYTDDERRQLEEIRRRRAEEGPPEEGPPHG